MFCNALILIGAASLLPPTVPGSQSEGRKLSLDLYLQLQDVNDPQISPDGARIVYSRRWVDANADRWDSALWIMNADGGENRFLAKGSSPRWSPDGNRIAFLASDEEGRLQIFVRFLGPSGGTTQITRVPHAPANLAWSPDSNFIAFTMLVQSPPSSEWQIKLPARPPGSTWVAEPRVIDRLVFRRDDMGFLEVGHFHAFVVSVSGGAPRQLTHGEADYGGGPGFEGNLSWTPDGRELLLSSFSTQDWEYPWKNSEIFAVNLANGVLRQLTHRSGPDHNPVVSPDGQWVAYSGYDWTNDSYIASKLYVAGIDGSNRHALMNAIDLSLYSSPYGSPSADFWWAPDSTGLYFNLDERGTRNLYFAPLRGAVRQVTHGSHVLHVTSVSRNGHVVGTITGPHASRNVVTFTLALPEPRRLTAVNRDLFLGVRFGEVEEIWYDSVDKFRIQGWIVKPPGFDPTRKYPLILAIHGGPHAMYNVGFNYAWQHHASEGYVVLATNPRGSTGYGQAFANAINNDYPGKDYDDLINGVNAVVQRGYVDERNLFVYGCSGGGVLTAWIVGHTDRFAAASANCPVTDWLSFVGTTDGVSFYWNFTKLPWDDPSEHLVRSPLMFVGRVNTPTMLMTGELDRNTPIGQTEQFFRALKLRGVPTAMIRFQEEGHGTTSRPSNFLRTQLYLHRWFERFRRDDSPENTLPIE